MKHFFYAIIFLFFANCSLAQRIADTEFTLFSPNNSTKIVPGIDSYNLSFRLINNGPASLYAGDSLMVYFSDIADTGWFDEMIVNGQSTDTIVIVLQSSLPVGSHIDSQFSMQFHPGVFPEIDSNDIYSICLYSLVSNINLTDPDPQNGKDCAIVTYYWPIAVKNIREVEDVLIYPNPAFDKVNISHAGAGTMLQLRDITGRTLHTKILNAEYDKVDLSAYPSGSYIIRLIDKNGGNVIRKVVKG